MEEKDSPKRTYVKKEKHEFYRALDITPTDLANYVGFSRQYVVRAIDKIANDSNSLTALKNALMSINTEKTNRILNNLKIYCDKKSINIEIDVDEKDLSPLDRIKKFINQEIIRNALMKDIVQVKEYIGILDYLDKYQKK
jgi:predicted regulator of amino acid metabolism with ACT domain